MRIPGTTSPRPTTVLILDDEEPIRRVLDRILQSAGYVTRLASTGAEALAVAGGRDPIDLLLTDLMMPEMNGDEVARRLRQTHPALKVLYYTGYCDRLFENKGTMWEDEAYLEKPCSAKAVLEAVSLLRHRNRRIGDVYPEQTRVPSTEGPVKAA
jgi:two-component system cell cycle sensor histidine kinase/response regulator CckA